MIKFQCSQCGEELEAPASMSGERLQCPSCRYPEIIPEPEPEPEPIKLEFDVDEDETDTSDKSASKISFSVTGSEEQQYRFKRPMSKNQFGATRVKMFHARMSDSAMSYLEGKINEFIDENPDVEVKHTNIIVGEVEEKSRTVSHLIVTIWY